MIRVGLYRNAPEPITELPLRDQREKKIAIVLDVEGAKQPDPPFAITRISPIFAQCSPPTRYRASNARCFDKPTTWGCSLILGCP
jgi:hypothetical protein